MLRLARVSGQSMAPTLRPSDLLLTGPVGPAGLRRDRGFGAKPSVSREEGHETAARGGPRRGDVVVLRRGRLRMVKRVVAVAGDVVELEAGRLFVDGRPIDGRARVGGALTQTWRVPAGHLFVAGDNPARSDDSRLWAEPFVAVADVEGRVLARLPRLPRLPKRAGPRGVSPRRPAAAARRAARFRPTGARRARSGHARRGS